MSSERAVDPAGGEALFDASDLLREVLEPEPIPDEPPGWTIQETFQALEDAWERDEVLRILLRYARDFLEAAAVFAVVPDGIVGVDAVGWPGARARCRSVRLASQPGGLLGTTLTTRGPSLGPLARDPGNERLIAGLGRAWPAVALAAPILVRERVVCLLFADNGEAPVSGRRIGDLLLVAGAVGAALERLLRSAKATVARRRANDVHDEGGWSVREPAQGAPVPAASGTSLEDSPPEEFQVVGPRRP